MRRRRSVKLKHFAVGGPVDFVPEAVAVAVTEWEEKEDTLSASWTFSCILDLPWKPRLAAGGSTTHVFDEAFPAFHPLLNDPPVWKWPSCR
eukprot:678635-Prorocentrum_minimum.AAC.1